MNTEELNQTILRARALAAATPARSRGDVLPCPDCHNAGRHARRRCRAKGGLCGGTGFIVKSARIRYDLDTPSA